MDDGKFDDIEFVAGDISLAEDVGLPVGGMSVRLGVTRSRDFVCSLIIFVFGCVVFQHVWLLSIFFLFSEDDRARFFARITLISYAVYVILFSVIGLIYFTYVATLIVFWLIVCAILIILERDREFGSRSGDACDEKTLTITSDEVNYLIYRYLQESGFTHSSFTFVNESFVSRANFDGNKILPGALVTYLQKGLQYAQIESHLRDDGSLVKCNSSFSLVAPHVCSVRPDNVFMDKDVMRDDALDVPASCIRLLKGHLSEAFFCACNPTQNILATGSADSTARLWKIPPIEQSKDGINEIRSSTEQPFPFAVLMHGERVGDKSRDVTSLEWNFEGTLLASGSFDGLVRVWTTSGSLLKVLTGHKAAIAALRWNKSGKILMSCSVDKTCIAWNVEVGAVLQRYMFSDSPLLDVDWKDDDTFVVCSTDHLIYVGTIGSGTPTSRLSGHIGEVNSVRWNNTGTVLASCSDDCSVKVWNQSSRIPLFDLTGHTKETYAIRWSPAKNSTILASASYDCTVRIWDATDGRCIKVLSHHTEPVYSIAFSPDGSLIASGSFDNSMLVWELPSGKLLRRYCTNGGVFDVSWTPDGQREYCLTVNGYLSQQQNGTEMGVRTSLLSDHIDPLILPEELVLEIFSYLDPESVFMCTSVSVEWHRLAFDPLLWVRIVLREFGDDLVQFEISKMSQDDIPRTGIEWKRLFERLMKLRLRLITVKQLDHSHASLSNEGRFLSRRDAESSFRGCIAVTEQPISPQRIQTAPKCLRLVKAYWFEITVEALTVHDWSGTFALGFASISDSDMSGGDEQVHRHVDVLRNFVGFKETSDVLSLLDGRRSEEFCPKDKIGIGIFENESSDQKAIATYNGEYRPCRGLSQNNLHSLLAKCSEMRAVVEVYGRCAAISIDENQRIQRGVPENLFASDG